MRSPVQTAATLLQVQLAIHYYCTKQQHKVKKKLPHWSL